MTEQRDNGFSVFVADGGWTLVEGFGQARTWTLRLWKARSLGCNALYFQKFFPVRQLPVGVAESLDVDFGALFEPWLDVDSTPAMRIHCVLGVNKSSMSQDQQSPWGPLKVPEIYFGEPETYPILGPE